MRLLPILVPKGRGLMVPATLLQIVAMAVLRQFGISGGALNADEFRFAQKCRIIHG
jgi:hypothetical protein